MMCVHISRKKTKKTRNSAVDCLLDMDNDWSNVWHYKKRRKRRKGRREGEERRKENVIISNITVFLLMHFYAS